MEQSPKCKCGGYLDNDNIFCLMCRTKMSSVIVEVGGMALHIPANEWKEREQYRELKRKWDWLD